MRRQVFLRPATRATFQRAAHPRPKAVRRDQRVGPRAGVRHPKAQQGEAREVAKGAQRKKRGGGGQTGGVGQEGGEAEDEAQIDVAGRWGGGAGG